MEPEKEGNKSIRRLPKIKYFGKKGESADFFDETCDATDAARITRQPLGDVIKAWQDAKADFDKDLFS